MEESFILPSSLSTQLYSISVDLIVCHRVNAATGFVKSVRWQIFLQLHTSDPYRQWIWPIRLDESSRKWIRTNH